MTAAFLRPGPAEVDLDFSLAGRVAVVTGGGSGIGAAIAAAFAEKGATVVVADRDEEAAVRVAAALRGSHLALGCDVTDRGGVEELAAEVERRVGVAGILVNCAGLAMLDSAETLDDRAWHTTLGVNLTGTFLMSQVLGARMLAAGHGRIVNLASQAATVALDRHAAYCASKAGVLGLTRVLALEWGRRGVTVNSISPTVVLTPLGRAAWSNASGEAHQEQIPVGRFAVPAEIAAAAVYLASDAAAMVNGADLVIDGGFTVQ